MVLFEICPICGGRGSRINAKGETEYDCMYCRGTGVHIKEAKDVSIDSILRLLSDRIPDYRKFRGLDSEFGSVTKTK